jgi:hypothetical protein
MRGQPLSHRTRQNLHHEIFWLPHLTIHEDRPAKRGGRIFQKGVELRESENKVYPREHGLPLTEEAAQLWSAMI